MRRVLNNNIGTSRDTKYVSGDSVYLERANDKLWKGLGKVLGQEGQQVLMQTFINMMNQYWKY